MEIQEKSNRYLAEQVIRFRGVQLALPIVLSLLCAYRLSTPDSIQSLASPYMLGCPRVHHAKISYSFPQMRLREKFSIKIPGLPYSP